MAGCDVELESGGLKESFRAVLALKGGFALVTLEMVVHRVLIVLRNAADAADIISRFILLILVWH